MNDVYVSKPNQDTVLEVLRQKLEAIHRTSKLGTVVIDVPHAFDAYITMVTPQECPACLYDPQAALVDGWAVVEREQFILDLPTPWDLLDPELVEKIIDTLVQYGHYMDCRFMTSPSHGKLNYFITSAKMICLLHAEPTGALQP